MKIKNKGFTLIEILVGILIFTIAIIGGFYALMSLNQGKPRLLAKTDITKDVSYITENLFEKIKSGRHIDYEEYFNRSMIGTGRSDGTGAFSGHYFIESGFGNYGLGGSVGSPTYGGGMYFCFNQNRNGNGSGITDTTSMVPYIGCIRDFNILTNINTVNPYLITTNSILNTNFSSGMTNIPNTPNTPHQRYGQYVYNFFYKNIYQESTQQLIGNNTDLRNMKYNIISEGGPILFDTNDDVRELYLIDGDRGIPSKNRLYYRWNWKQDPNAPRGTPPCNDSTFTDGCIGNLEFLRLDGKDRGYNHSSGTTIGSAVDMDKFDGITDTWVINKDFNDGEEGDIIAGNTTNNNSFWKEIFPNTISVTNFQVFIYPNNNSKYHHSRRKNQPNQNQPNQNQPNQYVRIIIELQPSWKKRILTKGFSNPPKYKIATTINLSDHFAYENK